MAEGFAGLQQHTEITRKIRRWRKRKKTEGVEEEELLMQMKRKRAVKGGKQTKKERQTEISPEIQTKRDKDATFMHLLQQMSHKLHSRDLHNHTV